MISKVLLTILVICALYGCTSVQKSHLHDDRVRVGVTVKNVLYISNEDGYNDVNKAIFFYIEYYP